MMGGGSDGSTVVIAPPFNPDNIAGLTSWWKAGTDVYMDGAVQMNSADKGYFQISDNASISATNVLEIGGWVYLDSVGADRPIVLKGSSRTAAANLEYILYYANTGTNFKFSVSNGSTITTVTDTGTAPSTATWYFLRAGLKSDGTLFIQRNNATEITSASTPNIQDSTNTLYLGYNPGDSTYMNGRIDSLYITKTISSAGEITSLYNSGNGRMYGDLTVGNSLDTFQTNLISWWGFNEENGTRFDAKGTNHWVQMFNNLIDGSTNNGGFETLGGGGTDVFGSWSESGNNRTATSLVFSGGTGTLTFTAHEYVTGQVVTISGVTGGVATPANANGSWSITVVDANSFTFVPTLNPGDGTCTGTIVFSGISSTSDAYSGSRALRLEVDSSSTFIAETITGVVATGRKYKITFRAKCGATQGYISFAGSSTYQDFTFTTSYAQYTCYFTADSTGLYFQRKPGSGASSTVYLDDVVLVCTEIASNAGIAAGLATDGNLATLFDGTNTTLSVSTNSTLEPGTGDFAYGGWFFLSVMPTGQTQVIMEKGATADATAGYMIDVTDGTLVARFTDGTGTRVTATATTTVAVNKWYYVVVNHTRAGNMEVYVNGTSEITANISAKTGSVTGTTLTIGDYSFNYLVTGGRLDSWFFVKRVCTGAEITSLYNNGKGVKYVNAPSTLKAESSLSYWNLDEYSAGTGAVTRADSGSNANNLSTTGNPKSTFGVAYYEGAVSKWLDSKATNNLIQDTQSKKLLYRTGQINSLAVITGDALTKSLYNTSDIIGTGDMTLFVVIKPRGWGGSNTGRIIDNKKFLLYVNATSSRLKASSDGGTTTAVSAVSSIALNTGYVVAVTRTSAGTFNFIIGGSASGTADQASGTPAAGTSTYMFNNSGGTLGYDGDIGDVLLYNSVLSAGNITNVTNYLKTKFNL